MALEATKNREGLEASGVLNRHRLLLRDISGYNRDSFSAPN